MRRQKKEAGHAWRKAMEAGFRCKASVKDGEKSVQCDSESSDEHCKKKRKEKSQHYPLTNPETTTKVQK